jgi:iron transport multicopper oxidase
VSVKQTETDIGVSIGLASVFIEAPDVAQQRMTLPPVFNEQCAKMNMPYTGNVVGFNSTSNFKGEP